MATPAEHVESIAIAAARLDLLLAQGHDFAEHTDALGDLDRALWDIIDAVEEDGPTEKQES